MAYFHYNVNNMLGENGILVDVNEASNPIAKGTLVTTVSITTNYEK
jgi:hypothetical protein